MNKELISFAETAALSAGKIILGSTNNIKVDFKGKTDLITNIDLESERSIIDKIIKSHPSHNILSEEHGLINNNSDYLWVIDPLDGTTNFVHGYPSYGVSIGLVYKNNPEIDAETLGLKLDEAILKEMPILQRGLWTIALLAAVSPLLGLLGTVTGII